jgi:S-DNA-T family DNA segregation ATPase FtsK/SpoIIIE
METHRKILKTKKDHGLPKKIPYLVVVIGELQDLMRRFSAEVENAITNITVMARAAGIHLIVGTRRPSPDVVTESIKTYLPAKFAFQTASAHHSRIVLGANGAEKLHGKGDMFLKVDDCPEVHPVQCDGLDDDGVDTLVHFWAGQRGRESRF